MQFSFKRNVMVAYFVKQVRLSGANKGYLLIYQQTDKFYWKCRQI